MVAQNLLIADERLAEFCRRRHIRKLSLFGSVLTPAFGADSDIDVLIEFEPGKTPGLDFIDIQQELSGLLGGQRVDLLTPKFLKSPGSRPRSSPMPRFFMPKSDMVYLGHMYDTACDALERMKGKRRADFDSDINLQLALVYLVQTLGESARRITEPTRQAHPTIPWPQIVGMRHKIVHDYMSVDLDIVYEVVTRDLPVLVTELEKIVPME